MLPSSMSRERDGLSATRNRKRRNKGKAVAVSPAAAQTDEAVLEAGGARLAAEQQRAHRRLAQLERATEEFRRVEAYAVQQFVRHEPNRPIKLEPHVVLEVRILDWRYDGRSASASGGEGSSSSGGGAEGEAHSLYAVHGVDRHPCGPADDWRVSIDVGSEAVEELGIELWGSALLGAADVHVLKLLRGEQTTASLVGEHEVALVAPGAGGGEVGAVQLQIEAHPSHKYRDALTHETPAPGLVAHSWRGLR